MIGYRAFRNSDPPAIAEIWRSQPGIRARALYISTTMLERLVLAKPYFDREGLVVATEQDRPIGFAHAGFGPNPDGSALCTEAGVTSLVMVAPHEQQQEIASALLARAEDFLRSRGAQQLYAGGARPLTPFYLGLYGGNDLPGVLASDEASLQLYRGAGYREVERRLILQRKLAGFRPLMDRAQMQLRRQCRIVKTIDPRPANWWEACLTSYMDRVRYSLKTEAAGEPCGEAVFWDIEPLATGWGLHARGLIDLWIEAPARSQGLATFLLGDAMKEMRAQGVALVEAHAEQDNQAALRLLAKLGFSEVEQGMVFRKDA